MYSMILKDIFMVTFQAIYNKTWLLRKVPHTDFPIDVKTLNGEQQPDQWLDRRYSNVHFKVSYTSHVY